MGLWRVSHCPWVASCLPGQISTPREDKDVARAELEPWEELYLVGEPFHGLESLTK